MAKTLESVKSLLLNFEGSNGIQASVRVGKSNYKNIAGLLEQVRSETESKSIKFLSAIEEDEPYDWQDCLMNEDGTLDTQFIEKIFSDPILDDKLNLLISEKIDLTMENLEAIEVFEGKENEFANFILKENFPNLKVEDADKWLDRHYEAGDIIGLTASNGKIIYAITEAEEDEDEDKKEKEDKEKEDEKEE